MSSTETVTETTAPVTEAPPVAAEATTPPPADAAAAPAPEAPPAPAPTPEEVQEGNRYERSLQRLMQQARDNRRQQMEQQQQQQALEYARRIQEASQYGPDAVLKAAGVQQQKFDIREILGETDDGEPPTVKELKSKVAQLEEFIKAEQKSAEQRKAEEQQAQMAAWEQNELAKIGTFVQSNKEKYPFVAELESIGSTRDMYSGIINMYQAGYTPSYDDVAELVENRIEDILDKLAQSKKFSDWAAKRLKAQTAPPPQTRPTLTGALTADSAQQVPPDNESDAENRRRALQAAYAAREAALKQIKAQTGQ